jgi:hypothetical protein
MKLADITWIKMILYLEEGVIFGLNFFSEEKNAAKNRAGYLLSVKIELRDDFLLKSFKQVTVSRRSHTKTVL